MKIIDIKHEGNKDIVKYDDDTISTVTFIHSGTEKDVDLFLKTLIVDYLREHKMISWQGTEVITTELKLQEVTQNDRGQFQEVFATDNPRIKDATFTYIGEEDDLTNFLKLIIFDYARENKLIDQKL